VQSNVRAADDRDGAGAWLRLANHRPVGRVEFREVTIEIGSGAFARVLVVRTLREQDGDKARSLFCVIRPLPFSNVNYVATETRGRPGFDSVQLYLPYLTGTLRDVAAEKHREGFLGSDFTYRDLRVWLPEERCRYQVVESAAGQVRLCGAGEGFDGPIDLELDPGDGFVSCILHRETGGAVVREYRAAGKQLVDGVAIPAVMTMVDHRRKHVTTIRLQRAWYDRAIDPAVFDAAFRSRTREYLLTL
jgi:hypothetical protein